MRTRYDGLGYPIDGCEVGGLRRELRPALHRLAQAGTIVIGQNTEEAASIPARVTCLQQ